MRLGELLLENEEISNVQLQEAIKEQYWRKNGFWIIDRLSFVKFYVSWLFKPDE
ncbi:hypothetical protein H6F42_20500 [Pseudanabaena sp. FACHB-1998]|nr:hypothetical protein [Pseudanabaena sp. FACHB-1998]